MKAVTNVLNRKFGICQQDFDFQDGKIINDSFSGHAGYIPAYIR